MSGRLTRHAYEQLIAEDLEWLEKQPRSLERDHIAMVLRESADATYGSTSGRPRTATGASLRHDAALDKNAIRAQRDALWQLLDDIDTLDDSARGHDNVFRDKARAIQKKRWAIHNPDDPRRRCELCMDLVDNRWRACPNAATRVVSDDRGRPLHICEEHFKRAVASWVRPIPNRMDAPGAPQCGCGRPSTHESGWCGTECEAKFGGTVIVVHRED